MENNFSKMSRPAQIEELLSLLGQVQQDLSMLLPSDPVREDAKDAVRAAQREARRQKPDIDQIADWLKAARKLLKNISCPEEAALAADKVLSNALDRCSKITRL